MNYKLDNLFSAFLEFQFMKEIDATSFEVSLYVTRMTTFIKAKLKKSDEH